jgi:hypothetical protein
MHDGERRMAIGLARTFIEVAFAADSHERYRAEALLAARPLVHRHVPTPQLPHQPEGRIRQEERRPPRRVDQVPTIIADAQRVHRVRPPALPLLR